MAVSPEIIRVAVPDKHGRKWLFHDGGIDGFTSFISRNPADHTLVLMLSNENLAAIAYGEPYNLPKEYKFAKVESAVPQRYVGIYRLPWGSVLVVTAKGGKLYVAGKNQDASELKPLSPTKFYLEDDDREFEFLSNDTGTTTSLMFGTFQATRIGDPPQ